MILKNIYGKSIGMKFCLPAQHIITKEPINRDELNNKYIYTNKEGHECYRTDRTVTSSNKAEIFFSEFERFNIDTTKKSASKIIIHAFGNNDSLMKHNSQLAEDAATTYNCKVIGFDFRNVAKSTGELKCEQDLVDDALAVINYYHKVQGVPLDNIILSGHSMGAAILTIAAAKIYKDEKEKAKKLNKQKPQKIPCVSLMNDRSFRDFADVGVELLTNGKLPRIFKAIGKIIFTIILKLSFGTIDAAKAYNSLPMTHKDYIFSKDDPVICGTSNLHYAVRGPYKELKQQLKTKVKNNPNNPQILKSCAEVLLWIKQRKLSVCPFVQEDINKKFPKIPDRHASTSGDKTKIKIKKPPQVHNLPLRHLRASSAYTKEAYKLSTASRRYQSSIQRFLNR